MSAQLGSFTSYFGASASGTVIAGGVITIEDIRRGEINHAVSLGVLDAQAGAFSWPANRTDGTLVNRNVIKEGQRLRLNPALDLTKLNLTPIGRIVAKAAQKYGLIVVDRSGVVGVGTEAGRLEQARTGVNPWDTLLPGPTYEAMRNFPWQSLQALPVNYGKPSTR